MSLRVRLFPGFPLPVADYADMMDGLAGYEGPRRHVVVAHSLGALEALSDGSVQETAVFLLAPSIPERRRTGRPVLRGALRLLGRTPGGGAALARRLRAGTYRRYGAQAPVGAPLPLREAADRLRRAGRQAISPPSAPCVVLCSDDDARHPAQLRLAERLGTTAHGVEGGHLFPITRGRRTAETILEVLDDLDHRSR